MGPAECSRRLLTFAQSHAADVEKQLVWGLIKPNYGFSASISKLNNKIIQSWSAKRQKYHGHVKEMNFTRISHIWSRRRRGKFCKKRFSFDWEIRNNANSKIINIWMGNESIFRCQEWRYKGFVPFHLTNPITIQKGTVRLWHSNLDNHIVITYRIGSTQDKQILNLCFKTLLSRKAWSLWLKLRPLFMTIR